MVDLTDLLDPKTWEGVTSAAKATTAVVDALGKMRDRLSRRTPKRKLDQEVDELRADLTRLINVMSKHVESQGRLQEAWLDLLRTVVSDDVKNQVKAHVGLLMSVAVAAQGLQQAAKVHEDRLRVIEEASPPRRTVKKPKVSAKRMKRRRPQ